MARTKATLRTAPRGRVLRRGAKLNQRQKRQVKSLIGRRIETKFVDALKSSTGIVSSGTLFNLNVPSSGTGISGRIGDRVTVRRIDFAYQVIGYDTTNQVRVIIFKWQNDNSVYAPSTITILDPAYTSTADCPLAPYNWDNFHAKDFAVCYDKVHSLSFNNTTAAPGSQSITVRGRVYGKKLHNKFMNLNTGAVTGDGIYYCLVVSDSGIAGHPKFNMISRMQYTDA